MVYYHEGMVKPNEIEPFSRTKGAIKSAQTVFKYFFSKF